MINFAENTMPMLRAIAVGAVLCIFVLRMPAQSKVTIIEDPGVTKMMEQYSQEHKALQAVEGWRVQILATPDRQNLDRSLQTFQSRFPSLSADWVHHNPYYKIRVGAFTTKLEAMRLLYLLKPEYPGAYLVADNKMKPSELLGNY
jgi:hypothetical protein